MNDPYQVLGVSPSASDDEIKLKYRELAKKYHPDNYVNNPLADLAQEKMKEINEAYDTIVKSRASGQRGYNSGTAGSKANPTYQQIRAYISSGNVALAEQMLSQISTHDAEWHFLIGSVMLRKGWYDEAKRHFMTAYQMEPSNPEYASVMQRMQSAQGQAYQPYQNNACGLSCCDCCTAMICADMCCN